jgi:Na+-driven multidrug efflux pump
MYATAVSLILVQIPLALVLPVWMSNGIIGVWYAVVIALTLQAVFLLGLFFKKTWLVVKI